MTVTVAEDTHSFVTSSGTMCRLGYSALDDAGRYLRDGDHLVGGGRCLAFNVAGTSHRREAVQHPSFTLGSVVRLRPEPENPQDPNAIGIWDRSGTIKAGFVPRTLSAQAAASFRGGLPLGGAVLSEYRLGSPTGERVGLQIAAAPASVLVLDVRRAMGDLRLSTSVDVEKVFVRMAHQDGVPVTDAEHGLKEALELLVAHPGVVGFISAGVEGSDCGLLSSSRRKHARPRGRAGSSCA